MMKAYYSIQRFRNPDVYIKDRWTEVLSIRLLRDTTSSPQPGGDDEHS